MRRILAVILMVSAGYAPRVPASVLPPGHPAKAIRVRISEAVPQVSIRGYDLKFQGRSAGDKVTRWELRCRNGIVTAKGPKTISVSGPLTIESPSGFIQLRERPYRERLHVHPVGALCEVVNEVDVERYLDGLVNSEFSPKWSAEAIGAQVVAARTYAYYAILRARERRYDVDASVRDQVYDGSHGEDYRASRAVEKTRGLVLMAKGKNGQLEPLKAFYHSTCGGRTELPEKVWGGTFPGFKRTVACPFCVSSPRFQWDLDLTAAEVSEAFVRGAREGVVEAGWPKNWVDAVRGAKLLDLRLAKVDASGRVPTVTAVFGDGKKMVELAVTGARFREWLGPGRLRSTAFKAVAHKGAGANRWRFEGRGNGHGVGMCQWGAKIMGDQGRPMLAILKHYYPDAEPRKLW